MSTPGSTPHNYMPVNCHLTCVTVTSGEFMNRNSLPKCSASISVSIPSSIFWMYLEGLLLLLPLPLPTPPERRTFTPMYLTSCRGSRTLSGSN